MISPEEIRRIAALANLELSEDEVEKFSRELSAILEFFAQLEEVDTSGVEPTAQITGLENITRVDEVRDFEASEELLHSSPNPIVRSQIEVRGVF